MRSFKWYLSRFYLIECYLLHGNMKNKTETKKTFYYISRGFVILELFKCRNNSLNDSMVQQYIAFFRAYRVIILKVLICNICNILWDHNLPQLLLDFFYLTSSVASMFYVYCCMYCKCNNGNSALGASMANYQSMTCYLFWVAAPATPQPKIPSHPQPCATCFFDGRKSQAQLQLHQILALIFILPSIELVTNGFLGSKFALNC